MRRRSHDAISSDEHFGRSQWNSQSSMSSGTLATCDESQPRRRRTTARDSMLFIIIVDLPSTGTDILALLSPILAKRIGYRSEYAVRQRGESILYCVQIRSNIRVLLVLMTWILKGWLIVCAIDGCAGHAYKAGGPRPPNGSRPICKDGSQSCLSFPGRACVRPYPTFLQVPALNAPAGL